MALAESHIADLDKFLDEDGELAASEPPSASPGQTSPRPNHESKVYL